MSHLTVKGMPLAMLLTSIVLGIWPAEGVTDTASFFFFSHEYILPNGMTLVKTLLYVDLKQVRPLSYNQKPVQSASSRHMSVAFCKSRLSTQSRLETVETEGWLAESIFGTQDR